MSTDTAAHKTLAEAFTAAQAEFPAVEPNAENGHFKNRFVTLGHLLAKVRPVLNRHGLAVIQLPTRAEDGAPVLRTTLMHVSGEKIEADAPLLLVKQDPQGQGSAITYMRRYALAAALGISDQEDDDGNSASEPATPVALVNDDDVAILDNLIRQELGLPHERVVLLFGAVGAEAPGDKLVGTLKASLTALSAAQGNQMANLLQRAIGKAAEEAVGVEATDE